VIFEDENKHMVKSWDADVVVVVVRECLTRC
jgi:hypothetical protein